MSLEDICKLIERTYPSIIAIDGELGAGKTTISNELSKLYGYPCIHLDDYLKRGQRQFINALNLNNVKAVLTRAKRPVIIEGVCILEALGLLGATPDVHIFLKTVHDKSKYKKSSIVTEVDQYINAYNAQDRANLKLSIMTNNQTNQLDVDIAYIKAKTLVSCILALGGIVSIIVGSLVLTSGIQSENSTIIKILDAEITAKGVGAVILSSSVLWAYFSYLSRPNYSRKKESRSNIAADGTHETYEYETATMLGAEPKNIDKS